jgi:hypothetical protein
MVNVNERPVDGNDNLSSDADDDSNLEDTESESESAAASAPQSGNALGPVPTVGRSANIGHNTTTTGK